MVTRQLLSFTQRIAILMILCFQPTGVDNVTSTGSQCGISLGSNATVSCTFQTPLCSGPQTQAYQLEIIGSGCQDGRRMLVIRCSDGQPYCTPRDEYGCEAEGHTLTLLGLFPCDDGMIVCENIAEKATTSCNLALSADEIKKSKRRSDSSTSEEMSTPRTEISTLDRQDASSSSNPYMSAVIVLVILVVILVVILLVILIKAVISYRCLVKENRQLSVTINQLKKKIKHMEDQRMEKIVIVQAPSSSSPRSHAIAIPGESKTRIPALEDNEEEVDRRGRDPSPDSDRRPDLRDPNAGAASTPSFPTSDLCAGDDSTRFVPADVHHTTAVEYVPNTSQQQQQLASSLVQNVGAAAASHGAPISTATPEAQSPSRSGPTEEEIQLDEGELEGESDPFIGIVDVRHDDNTEQFKGQADRENSEEQADEVFRVV